MAAAAAAFLAVQSVAGPQAGPATQPTSAPGLATRPARLTPDAPVIVAPIFKHGEGLGSAGGVVGAPRGRLSEQEAFDIIYDELQRHGINLTQRNVPVGELNVRVGNDNTYYDWIAEKPAYRYDVSQAPLLVDGLDSERQIAVEFISCEDYDSLDGPWHGRSPSTGYCVETLAVARSLAEQVNGQRAGARLAIFYDPLMTSPVELDYPGHCKSLSEAKNFKEDERQWEEWGTLWRRAHVLDKQEAGEVLKAQVRDFVDWLKAQGVT